MNDEYVWALPDDAVNELTRAATGLPIIDTTTRDIDPCSPAAIAPFKGYRNVDLLMVEIGKQLDEHGFALIDFSPLAKNIDLTADRRIITGVLSTFGKPVRIFDRWPLWKPIYTDTEIEPSRAGGTGFIPLHMDFVNAERPPEYTCFLCLRDDPLGGGRSVVARTDRAIEAISPAQRSLLADRAFTDGQVVNLSHVGRDINPFPVFDPCSQWSVRFTAKMLPRMPDSPHKSALAFLDQHLRSKEICFPLRPFELLIVDQRKAVHGREALAPNQSLLPPDQRRVLHQLFLRAG